MLQVEISVVFQYMFLICEYACCWYIFRFLQNC